MPSASLPVLRGQGIEGEEPCVAGAARAGFATRGEFVVICATNSPLVLEASANTPANRHVSG
jgi:hypothetical protein